LNGEHHEHDHEHDHGHHDEHDHMTGGGPPPGDEEELRARLEEELRKITVRDVLVQTVVTLINLGGQRLGLSGDTRPPAEASDPEQARVAIEAVRSLLPLLESDPRSAEQVKPVRDALAQLQMAYAQRAGASGGGTAEAGSGEPEAEPPPQQRPAGGGLWVPPGTKT
jgi:hypothetical protein